MPDRAVRPAVGRGSSRAETIRPFDQSNAGMNRRSLSLAVRTIGRSPVFAVTAVASLAHWHRRQLRRSSAWPTRCSCGRGPAWSTSRAWWTSAASPTARDSTTSATRLLLALRQSTQLEGVAGYRLDANAISLDNGRGGSEARVCDAGRRPTTSRCSAPEPAAGRLFQGDEDQCADDAPVAVISHALLDAPLCGHRPTSSARRIRVNGRPYTSSAWPRPGSKAPRSSGTDMWVPFAMAPHVTGRASMELLTSHGAVWHLGVARLKRRGLRGAGRATS